jgi:hypothetical protein
VANLTNLRRLQLAGNQLEALPHELGALAQLEGLWLHGNQLQSLPESIGELRSLSQLSLAGNRLRQIPGALGALCELRDLGIAGNELEALPSSLGRLERLEKLSAHGNRLRELTPSVAGLQSLRELWLQGNPDLAMLPQQLGELLTLKELSVADCGLVGLPQALSRLPALEAASFYGNRLADVPPSLLEAPSMQYLWLESNPLDPTCVATLLRALPNARAGLRGVGLDSMQLESVPGAVAGAAGPRLRASGVVPGGPGRGYFKLEQGGASPGAGRPRVLVVAFGSAPGVPNWGGLLRRVRASGSADDEDAALGAFDALFVVDPARQWYCGGDTKGFEDYRSRLASVCGKYDEVIMLGDSMGATAALMFADLATAVHAFCPQADLSSSSIRPARGRAWFDAMKRRVGEGVEGCKGSTWVHCGRWRHDLDQVNALPKSAPALQVKVYSVDSHRLALYLDRQGKLEALVRAAVLNAAGLDAGQVRLTNLV